MKNKLYCLGFCTLLLMSCYDNTRQTLTSIETPVVQFPKPEPRPSKPPAPSRIDTLFHHQITDAIFTGKINYETLDTLLAQGANINTVLKEDEQRMKLSAQLPIIKRFVEKPYYTVTTTNTPLMAVCFSVDGWHYDAHLYKLVKYLLENGANMYYDEPDYSVYSDGFISPLESIIYKSSFAHGAFDSEKNVERYLGVFVDNGFDVSKLEVSRYDGEWKLISYLTQQGVPKKINFAHAFNNGPNQKSWKELLTYRPEKFKEGWEFDFDGLEISSILTMGQKDVIRLLLDYGMSPDIRDSRSDVPLLFAVLYRDDVDFLRELVEEHGADVSVQYKNRTLLEEAEVYRKPACISYLESLNG